MLADTDSDVRAQAVNTVLTIGIKSINASGFTSQPPPSEDRGVNVDDNKISNDEYALTLEPSKEAAIANSKVVSQKSTSMQNHTQI